MDTDKNMSEEERDLASQKASLKASIEAILFTTGEAVEAGRIAAAVGETTAVIRAVLREMEQEYEQSQRGIRLISLEDSYQLCTKKELYPVVIQIAKNPKKVHLTDVMLEVLSIIAYKQPVTKIEVEKIRGVKSDHAVNRLVEYELVREVGRLDAPGRPILFATTENFLRHFGIRSVEELPDINPVKMEDFKAEAEEEVTTRLSV